MRGIVLTAMSLIVPGLAIPSAVNADYFYYAGTGHYYGLTGAAETWTQAEAEAVAAGGHLASITSQGEEDFLISTFVDPITGDSPYWIGLRDVNQSGSSDPSTRDFQWTTGEALNYTDWNSDTGEPNNDGGREWYVTFNFFGDTPGTWNDTYQGDGPFGPRLFSGIVELNSAPAAVPGPAGLVIFATGVIGLLGYGRRRRVDRA